MRHGTRGSPGSPGTPRLCPGSARSLGPAPGLCWAWGAVAGPGLLSAAPGTAAGQEQRGCSGEAPRLRGAGAGQQPGRAAAPVPGHHRGAATEEPRAQVSHLFFRVMSSKLNSKNGSMDFFKKKKKKS